MNEKESLNQEQALQEALKTIQKQFGKGSVMVLGENEFVDVEALPSGIMALDKALGIGGYPKGRVIEIYGPESSGKTTVALHAVAETQKHGGKVAFIDAEHAIDPSYAQNLGVDIDELILSQPDTGEQAMDIADILIKSGAIDLVIVDSVAALVPEQELEGEMTDQQMGLQARLMSKALRKLSPSLSASKATIIFINQLREKMSTGFMIGNNETTSGGRALKYYSSVRLDIRRIETLKKNNEPYGQKIAIKVVKNKVAPPFKTATVSVLYGEGVSEFENIIDLAIDLGIVTKSGSWFNYGETRIGQGRDLVKQYLKDNPLIYNEIKEKTREKLFETKKEVGA